MSDSGRQNIKVKIKRCSHPNFWYKELIGKVVPLIEMDESNYWCQDELGQRQAVMKQDGELIRIER